jgi:hypothetical protein
MPVPVQQSMISGMIYLVASSQLLLFVQSLLIRHTNDVMHLVGIIRLTEEEASRLPHKPAKLYGGKEGEYAGVLEVFHQLHCLVRNCYQLVPDHRILMLR